jgi:hypothetical protein
VQQLVRACACRYVAGLAGCRLRNKLQQCIAGRAMPCCALLPRCPAAPLPCRPAHPAALPTPLPCTPPAPTLIPSTTTWLPSMCATSSSGRCLLTVCWPLGTTGSTT